MAGREGLPTSYQASPWRRRLSSGFIRGSIEFETGYNARRKPFHETGKDTSNPDQVRLWGRRRGQSGALLESEIISRQEADGRRTDTFRITRNLPQEIVTTTLVDTFQDGHKPTTTITIDKKENPNYQYGELIARAIEISADPLRGPNGRRFKPDALSGSTPIFTFDDEQINLGYPEPFFSNNLWATLAPTKWGIVIGYKLYNTPDEITKHFASHTKDVTGPILHALAAAKNRLTPDILEQAPVSIYQDSIYMADPALNKMIQIHFSRSKGQELPDSAVQDAKNIVGDPMVQRHLEAFSSQAVRIETIEIDGTTTVIMKETGGAHRERVFELPKMAEER